MKKRLLIVLAVVMALVCVLAACDVTFTVTFDAQNGTDPTVVEFNGSFSLPTAPTNGDKVFGGWYTDKDCTDGNEWTIPTVLMGNVTVYAKWIDATPTPDTALATILAKYSDVDSWNFRTTYVLECDGDYSYDDVLNFVGENFSWEYEGYDENLDIATYKDYIWYDEAKEQYAYYCDNGDGTYDVYYETDDAEWFEYFYLSAPQVDLSTLTADLFTEDNDCYVATTPATVGNAVLGDWGDDCTFTEFKLYVANSYISKIVATQEDTSEDYAGTYTFTLEFSKYGEISITLPEVGDSGKDDPVQDSTLATILAKYSDIDSWNFRTTYVLECDGDYSYDDVLNFVGENFAWQYEYESETYVDYIWFDEAKEQYVYYYDNGDGTYTTYYETDDEDDFYELYASSPYLDMSALSAYSFTEDNGCYVATTPATVGNAVLGDWGDDCAFTEFKLYVANGYISKIVATQEDTSEYYAGTYTFTLEFSKYGEISITLPEVNDSGDSGDFVAPTDKQSYLNSVVETPVVGTEYVLALWQGNLSEVLYATGAMDENFLEMTENIASAAVVKLETATNGYYLKVGNKYVTLKGYAKNSYVKAAVSLTDTAMTVFTIGSHGEFVSHVVVDGKNDDFVLGTYNDYATISASSTSYISDVTKIDSTQFLARLIDCSGSGSGNGGSASSGEVMPEQTYNSETFDNENLQDKLLKYENSDGYEGGIGLPSTGTYNALVVPVQFGNKVITDTALNNLNIALNGTSAETGWESVNTYYNKSSFGKLNLGFDIWNYNIGKEHGNFTAKYAAKHYEDSTDSDGYSNGSDLLLKEVLSWLEDKIDLTKYDTNGDGYIDAVYLIYDNDVDYNDGDFWWAYVTWYQGEETYDGKGAYYYLFAGFDFMMEDVNGGEITDSVIEGLKVNAVTYIHETGHLLGLDDYYDYNTSKGSNKGLGGADMMDYNVGDHNKYSKIMLGWLEPTVITTTQTFTIDLTDNDTSNDCVLIFLNGNNSYFCEYLLVDLYSATGLNELHANASGTYLYGGAKFGARIYHVSSAIDNPYNEDEYGSFTNNNNSVTKNELIKLVEADGKTSSSKTKDGIWASASDLWQTGSTLKTVFPNYARQDGKLLNFDISFDSVTATSATITVTFATAE